MDKAGDVVLSERGSFQQNIPKMFFQLNPNDSA